MKRRTFLAGAGAGLIAVPRIVRAQQEPRRVAFTHSVRPLADLMPDGDPRYAAYHDEMRRLGWIEGVNLVTEYWSGAGISDRDDWVRQIYASKPDVVVFGGYGRLVRQLLREVGSVPTIIVGADPLAAGLVTSLARPGGSITGFSVSAANELSGKQLQLLSEAVPSVGRVAYFGPVTPGRMWKGPC